MSIIGNVDYEKDGYRYASAFLSHFERAVKEMKAAEQAILECASRTYAAEDAKRYKALHKKMVRVRKEWARLEQAREAPTPSPPSQREGNPSD